MEIFKQKQKFHHQKTTNKYSSVCRKRISDGKLEMQEWKAIKMITMWVDLNEP